MESSSKFYVEFRVDVCVWWWALECLIHDYLNWLVFVIVSSWLLMLICVLHDKVYKALYTGALIYGCPSSWALLGTIHGNLHWHFSDKSCIAICIDVCLSLSAQPDITRAIRIDVCPWWWALRCIKDSCHHWRVIVKICST